MNIKFDERLSFWNDRAKLGQSAGSNDEILKSIEMLEISKSLKDGLKILEIGCGNGITAIDYIKKFNVDILAIDYAEKMIEEANKNLENNQNLTKGKVVFKTMRLNDLESINEKFDLIYSERVLINLDSWDDQREILIKISNLLNQNGIFCMCENSIDGLNKINEFRGFCNLNEITPPWHNRYFKEEELISFSDEKYMKLIETRSFTSTYYFLSRVVNAALAKEKLEEPQYDSPINLLSLSLPPIGDFGQTKLWLWSKNI